MKKFFSLMLIISAMSVFCACTNEEAPITTPEEVTLTLDYSFAESGNMTRATGEEVYGNFYDKYIKTKILTPTTYSLTFINKETNKAVMVVDGKWNGANNIRLPEGNYVVTGNSQPIEKETYYGYEYPSDTAYLTFNEEVRIVKDMSNLTLKANYDSFLLLFDVANIEEIKMSSQKSLTSNEDVYWLFMRDVKYRTSSGTTTGYYDLNITRKNGDVIDLELETIPFEKGKYYYFNDMTNSFDIPKMESGN